MAKLNHNAWDKLFETLNIIERIGNEGYYDISAIDIKNISGREPRLMTKIDYCEALPEIMAKEGLSILAISNGLYRIAKTNPFMKIEPLISGNIKKIKPITDISTINPFSIKTESQVLDICGVNGILDEVFGEECDLTIRGRIRVDSEINFRVDDMKYVVNGVQIEVDGGYEGRNSVNLIEAKIGGRQNLSIRQLIYPELFWKSRIKTKVVKSFVLLFERKILRFIPFYIIRDGEYLLDSGNEKRFQFIDSSADVFDIKNIPIKDGMLSLNAPFPQADDFDKVLSMFIYITTGFSSKEELSKEFDIVERQIYYYYSVLEWLGLCEYQDDQIILTKRGLKLANLPKNELLKELSKIIFSSKIFHDALKNGIDGVNFDDFKIWAISGSTITRRLQTVSSWIRYFKDNI